MMQQPTTVSVPQRLPGFVFRPTNQEIFTLFLPQRQILGPESLSSYNGVLFETNLYGTESPDELFGHSEETEFYFFTALDGHSKNSKKIKREVAGKGTWSCKGKRGDCVMLLEGREIRVGSKRQFKFQYSPKNPCKDDTISWIMHEYLADKDYINNEAKKYENINSHKINENIIAFCYVYKKVEKRTEMSNKRKGDCLLTEESENICIEAGFGTAADVATLHTMHKDDHFQAADNNVVEELDHRGTSTNVALQIVDRDHSKADGNNTGKAGLETKAEGDKKERKRTCSRDADYLESSNRNTDDGLECVLSSEGLEKNAGNGDHSDLSTITYDVSTQIKDEGGFQAALNPYDDEEDIERIILDMIDSQNDNSCEANDMVAKEIKEWERTCNGDDKELNNTGMGDIINKIDDHYSKINYKNAGHNAESASTTKDVKLTCKMENEEVIALLGFQIRDADCFKVNNSADEVGSNSGNIKSEGNLSNEAKAFTLS